MRKTKNQLFQGNWGHTILCLLLLASLSTCQSTSKQQSEFPDFDPDKDYFPDKVSIDHSVGFDIEYKNHYKILRLFRHYNQQVDTVDFVMLQRGTPVPEGYQQSQIIPVPVEKAVSLSTTHLGMFEMLDAFDELKGVEIKQYISNPEIIRRTEQGQITEVAPAGVLNVETVINMTPDVLMAVGYPNSQNENYQQLAQVGIPVVLNADWQETDLLGRAEWVKLLAALLNKEALVNEKFKNIEERFNQVLGLVQKAETKPLTITGIAQGDVWHVAGGRSFAYHVLNVAGSDYPWKHDASTGSLKLDFETVYEFGLRADFWVAPGSARTLEDIRQRDTRYSDFKSYKLGQIYNIFGRYTEGGGNDYYERGVIEPDVVLKDVVKIFHPELLPNHKLVYYSQLK